MLKLTTRSLIMQKGTLLQKASMQEADYLQAMHALIEQTKVDLAAADCAKLTGTAEHANSKYNTCPPAGVHRHCWALFLAGMLGSLRPIFPQLPTDLRNVVGS